MVIEHEEKFLRMSSHYSTKHGGVNPEDPEFKKAETMDSVLNKEKMNISEIYKKRLQGLMKGIKRCKRKKKDDGYIWLTYHVVLMECHV